MAQGGHERRHVLRTVEAVAEPGEGARVGGAGEGLGEGGRGRPQGLEDPLEPGLEEVGPAVGEARGEQPRHLGVSRIGIAPGQLHRVEADPGGGVEAGREAVEERPQPRGPGGRERAGGQPRHRPLL